jgi:hypothetical protein
MGIGGAQGFAASGAGGTLGSGTGVVRTEDAPTLTEIPSVPLVARP